MNDSKPRIVPCTVKAALKLVHEWHRKLPDLQGGLFAARCIDAVSGECVGVGIAGSPPPAWEGTGRLVISRVATTGYENACSMLYGALCRAAKALGYKEVWTYTHLNEPGTSLRAAGFIEQGLTSGGELDRAKRPRKKVVNPERKRRWLKKL